MVQSLEDQNPFAVSLLVSTYFRSVPVLKKRGFLASTKTRSKNEFQAVPRRKVMIMLTYLQSLLVTRKVRPPHSLILPSINGRRESFLTYLGKSSTTAFCISGISPFAVSKRKTLSKAFLTSVTISMKESFL